MEDGNGEEEEGKQDVALLNYALYLGALILSHLSQGTEVCAREAGRLAGTSFDTNRIMQV